MASLQEQNNALNQWMNKKFFKEKRKRSESKRQKVYRERAHETLMKHGGFLNAPACPFCGYRFYRDQALEKNSEIFCPRCKQRIAYIVDDATKKEEWRKSGHANKYIYS